MLLKLSFFDNICDLSCYNGDKNEDLQLRVHDDELHGSLGLLLSQDLQSWRPQRDGLLKTMSTTLGQRETIRSSTWEILSSSNTIPASTT